MPAITPAPQTGDARVNGLLWKDKWAVSNLTFGFPLFTAQFTGYTFGEEPYKGFAPLDSVQQALVRSVYGWISSFTNLTFTELDTGASSQADLRFGQSDLPATAWAYLPDTDLQAGDSWYNRGGGKFAAPVAGTYGYVGFIHEIGHTLGLKHPHEPEGTGVITPAAYDSVEYTVMSYHSYPGSSLGGYTNGIYSFPQSYMMLDIAALQNLYGANFTASAGDDVYSWNPDTGQFFIDGAGQTMPGFNRVFQTVWDGGGRDTYDFSLYATALSVDLRPGEWTFTSSAQLANLGGGHMARGNIANALLFEGDLRSLIENVVGGSAGDTITGNLADNVIDGGLGADAMTGGLGNDVYVVDNIGDLVTELAGEGSDEIRTSLGAFSLAALPEVENLTGASAAGQSLTGNGGNNVITGAGGADLIDGGLGSDVMKGGAGNDIYLVDSAGDSIVELAGEGSDEVRTAVAVYSLAAFAEVEKLIATSDSAHDFRGNGGDNVIAGAGGNDFLQSQDGGSDAVNGGGGDDIVYFGGSLNALDAVDGGAGVRDVLVLQGNYALAFNGTTMSGIEFLSLQSGSITRFGDTAGNLYDYNLTLTDANVGAGVQLIVNAQSLLAGEDLIFDGSAELDGRFLIYGGHGVDTLKGGAGNDIFFFEGDRFGASDAVDGGGGRDSLVIAGMNGLNHIEFGDTALTSIESISVNNRFATDPSAVPVYELVLHDGNVAANAVMTINASSLGSGQTVNVDAHLELDGALNMFGGGGNDIFVGGAKGDLIYAAGGADMLTGGGDADTFQYRGTSDSAVGNADHILDFAGGTDRIDLGFIDANANTIGDQAFSFVGSAAFTGTAGELRAAFDAGNNVWTVSGDVDGDGNADFAILVSTITADPLAGTDFVL